MPTRTRGSQHGCNSSDPDERRRISIFSPSTRSARCRSTRCRRPTPVTPARRWRSRRSSTRSGTACCASIRRIRSGPIATASCFRTATRRCCCGRCCILTRHAGGQRRIRERSGSRRSRSTTSATSASSAARRPGHPEYHWVSGVETTTGPLGQGIATSVGHGDRRRRWLAARYNQPGFELFDYDIYAVCGDGCLMEGVGVRGGVARRSSRARQPVLDLRQQPHHDRRQYAESRSPRTSPRASRATAGTCCASATPTTSMRIEHALGVFRETARPADVHHPRQPHRLRFAATGRTPPRRTASRWARTKCGSPSARTAGPRTRSSSFRTACTSTSPQVSARAARRRTRAWTELFAAYREKYPRARERDRPDAATRAARRLGSQSAGVPRGSERHRRPRRVRTGAERPRAETSRGSWAGRPTSAVEQDGAEVRRRRRLRARARPAAGTCTSAFASTRWARSLNGLSLTKLRPFGATFFIFSDYARPAIRLSALMELPAICVFTHDAMGDGEDGPTHQPVEQLASLRAIPGTHAVPPRRCQRSRRGVPVRDAAAAPTGGAGAVAPAAAHARSDATTRARPASRAAPTSSPTLRTGIRR